MAFTKISFFPSINRQNVKFEKYSSILNMIYIITSIALTIQNNLYQTMDDNVRRVFTTLKVNIWEYFNSFIFINHTLILFSANIQTLSKTTALTFLKNIHHRTKRDDDLNISEECMEDTCVYEEVREFINYKKLDLTVASYLNILFCF